MTATVEGWIFLFPFMLSFIMSRNINVNGSSRCQNLSSVKILFAQRLARVTNAQSTNLHFSFQYHVSISSTVRDVSVTAPPLCLCQTPLFELPNLSAEVDLSHSSIVQIEFLPPLCSYLSYRG